MGSAPVENKEEGKEEKDNIAETKPHPQPIPQAAAIPEKSKALPSNMANIPLNFYGLPKKEMYLINQITHSGSTKDSSN